MEHRYFVTESLVYVASRPVDLVFLHFNQLALYILCSLYNAFGTYLQHVDMLSVTAAGYVHITGWTHSNTFLDQSHPGSNVKIASKRVNNASVIRSAMFLHHE